MVVHKGPPRASPRIARATPQRAQAPVRVVIIEEEGLLREGLRALLETTGEFVVTGLATSVAEAARSGNDTEIFIADLSLAGRERPDSVRRLKGTFPAARVLLLTSGHVDHQDETTGCADGDALVLKSAGSAALFAAIRRLVGERCGPTAALAPRPSPAPATAELSDREREVMRLIATGYRTREIAAALSLSHKTIEKHRTSLMRKLGLRNASAVAAYAIAHRLTED